MESLNITAVLFAVVVFSSTVSCRNVFEITAAETKAPVPQALCKLLFHDCGSVEGKVMNVQFNGTCSSGKAVLKKGTTIMIDFTFSANVDESELTSEVHGKIGVLPYVKFPLKNPNACQGQGLTCPVKANAKEDFLPTLDVLTSYPSVDVYVKWELMSKDGKDVFCAIMPATITD